MARRLIRGARGSPIRSTASSAALLFWDTLRQRGNNFLAHELAGKPPLLAFDYEMIVDGRELARPVNYALVRIVPPKGIIIDEAKRPFIIVDPRAGHGPGIGGFKQDSQVGVALKAGHPVYFVIFFARPEPGQTWSTSARPRAQFVEAVADRHPDSPKPALVGNCQGGWATMLLAASRPEITGPVVINGAPMSYWSGSWQGGEGENPMRYLGGLMGGSWVAMLTSDLGNGLVDGANFVANFERLNPANTLLEQVLPPVRQRRHRAAALPRIRTLVGWLLPDERRGTPLDRRQSVRRQPACSRRSSCGAAPHSSISRRFARRSSCSRRRATTSRRRNRRSIGSPTPTAARKRSRPMAR